MKYDKTKLDELEKENNSLSNSVTLLSRVAIKMNKRNDDLRKSNKELKRIITELQCRTKDEKIKAVEEFAQRLKKITTRSIKISPLTSETYIVLSTNSKALDNLVEEMKGEIR